MPPHPHPRYVLGATPAARALGHWTDRRPRPPGGWRGNAPGGEQSLDCAEAEASLGLGRKGKLGGDRTPRGPEGRASDGEQRVPGPEGGTRRKEGLSRSPAPPDAGPEAAPSTTFPHGGSGPAADRAVLGSRRPHISMVTPCYWKAVVFICFSTFWTEAI